MKLLTQFPIFSALPLLFATGMPVCAAPAIINLGTLGGTESFGFPISADGSSVAGRATTGSGDTHAFRWKNGSIQDLGTFGGETSSAAGISTDGSVVAGYATTGVFPPGYIALRAFRWQEGPMEDLGTMGRDNSFGLAISADGSYIVVWAPIPTNRNRAFRWHNGIMQDLGTLGGGSSVARAISADGSVVAGEADTKVNILRHAFRWYDGFMYDLGTLGGLESSGYAIGADGLSVAGDSSTSMNTIHAFRWNSDVMQDLGALTEKGFSYGQSISADGSLVAGYANSSSGSYHAFLYADSLGMVDLNTYLPALGINLTGWELISVCGFSADGSAMTGYGKFNGQTRAFLIAGLPFGANALTGACCVGTTCVVSRQWMCFGPDKIYQGDTTACAVSGQPSICCPADFNGSGSITVSDVFMFVNAWFANTPTADFNHSGSVTVPDIFAFLRAWFAGC